jgi:hypothetical protein
MTGYRRDKKTNKAVATLDAGIWRCKREAVKIFPMPASDISHIMFGSLFLFMAIPSLPMSGMNAL